MSSFIKLVAVVVGAVLSIGIAEAAESAHKVGDIRAWSDGAVHFNVSPAAPGCSYMYFDGTTAAGKSMLTTLTSARIARATVHLGYSGSGACGVQFVQMNAN